MLPSTGIQHNSFATPSGPVRTHSWGTSGDLGRLLAQVARRSATYLVARLAVVVSTSCAACQVSRPSGQFVGVCSWPRDIGGRRQCWPEHSVLLWRGAMASSTPTSHPAVPGTDQDRGSAADMPAGARPTRRAELSLSRVAHLDARSWFGAPRAMPARVLAQTSRACQPEDGDIVFNRIVVEACFVQSAPAVCGGQCQSSLSHASRVCTEGKGHSVWMELMCQSPVDGPLAISSRLPCPLACLRKRALARASRSTPAAVSARGAPSASPACTPAMLKMPAGRRRASAVRACKVVILRLPAGRRRASVVRACRVVILRLPAGRRMASAVRDARW